MSPDAPSDNGVRVAIIHEKERNVVVDAGAGTGKTKTLVDRLVERIAPAGPGDPLPLSRLAAITFTRRAAGELHWRIREALLGEMAKEASGRRLDLLSQAISQIDTAFIGTIHSFADRLLRMRPVEAGLSPAYEILEEEEEEALAREVTELLIFSAEARSLPELLAGGTRAGRPGPKEASEAQQTILDYLAAGLRVETLELEHQAYLGFDALVRSMIRHRDVGLVTPAVPSPDVSAVQAEVNGFMSSIEALEGSSLATRWLRALGRRLEAAKGRTDPLGLLEALLKAIYPLPTGYRKSVEFTDAGGTCDEASWSVWKSFTGGGQGEAGSLKDKILGPLTAWLGARLARLMPGVLCVYEQVKARHEVVDQTDLLIKLRDLLRDNPDGVRAFYQGCFDHILVDEFQDTDPLQAEILFYLAEDGCEAESWEDVKPAADKLTIVGDWKQSIYRFRRADIETYRRARQKLLEASPAALYGSLEVNFRSRPELLDFYNAQLKGLFEGETKPGGRAKGRKGEAAGPASAPMPYEPLAAGPRKEARRPVVHALPYGRDDGDKLKAEEGRLIEAEMLALYLRWLQEKSGLEVEDRETREMRPIQFGDIAVLATVTTSLPSLFSVLERLGVPYAARGGTLFLTDPTIRQLILGLRALADPADGVAQAALHSPPFFSVGPADAAAGKAAAETVPPGPAAEAAARWKQADRLIAEIRSARFIGPPSATARRLMEMTAFERCLSLLPNGAQKLRAAREVLFILDGLTAEEGLDFDAATARLRTWLDSPVALDPPSPTSGDALLVLTTHQAKGLEFPAVVLWDGFQQKKRPERARAWLITRDGKDWAIELDRFEARSPGAGPQIEHEKYQDNEEMKRLYYVAATRARDLLVIPFPQEPSQAGSLMSWTLVQGFSGPAVLHQPVFRPGRPPEWAQGIEAASAFPELRVSERGERAGQQARSGWGQARDAVCRATAVPAAVTQVAHGLAAAPAPASCRGPEEGEASDLSGERTARLQEGRFGPEFGKTVHRALETLLRGSMAQPNDIVRACAQSLGLTRHVDEALEDVRRALRSLDEAGLRQPGVSLYPEYPVCRIDRAAGQMLVGYVDLVAVKAETNALWVVDFKTDAPPRGPLEEAYPAYSKQARMYVELVGEASGGKGFTRGMLLFTASGARFEV